MGMEDEEVSKVDKLRAAERWFTLGGGVANCSSCQYKYDPEVGDDVYPVSAGAAQFVARAPTSSALRTRWWQASRRTKPTAWAPTAGPRARSSPLSTVPLHSLFLYSCQATS